MEPVLSLMIKEFAHGPFQLSALWGDKGQDGMCLWKLLEDIWIAPG